jgi:DNA repair ATPase RecN
MNKNMLIEDAISSLRRDKAEQAEAKLIHLIKSIAENDRKIVELKKDCEEACKMLEENSNEARREIAEFQFDEFRVNLEVSDKDLPAETDNL